MRSLNRRKVFLCIAAVIFCMCLVLAGLTLRGYTHTVPITVGPYRKTVFILLIFFLAAALGFAFHPADSKSVSGTLLIGFSVFWFTGKMLLTVRFPENALLPVMDQWMPVPLAAFGAGAALWADCFLPVRENALRLNEKWQLVLALLLMVIVLLPALEGGFNWDDAFFSVEAQAMRVSGESIFKRVWQEIVDYARIGRINPFATFHFLVFYFIPDPRAYRLLLFVLTLLNAGLFYRFLKLWSGSGRTALLSLMIVPLCFQLRMYHDPLNSYYGLMQVMFCELMGALIFNLKWLKTGKKGSLFLSLLFFLMGLMSYEMFFPFTIFFFITALSCEKKLSAAIRKVIPYVFFAALIFSLSILLRTNITEETAYNGTTFGLNLPVILRTFAYQSGAAFPLRYRTAGYDAGIFGQTILWNEIFNTSLPVFIKSIRWEDLLACLIIAVIFWKTPKEKIEFSFWRLSFGLLLWLLPGLVISLSEKYQTVLRPGLPYIPIYFSYFGMGMTLYEIIALMGKRFDTHILGVFFCGIGCAMLLMEQQDNRRVTDMLNDIFYYPRKTGEAALQAGILGNTDGKTILSAVPFSLWEHGWDREPYQSKFYSLNARKLVNAVGVMDFIDGYRETNDAWVMPPGVELITYEGKPDFGFARSGRLRGTGFDFESNELANTMVTDVSYFLSSDTPKGTALFYKTKDGEWKFLDVDNYGWVLNKTEKGTLYKLEEKNSVFFDTIQIITK